MCKLIAQRFYEPGYSLGVRVERKQTETQCDIDLLIQRDDVFVTSVLPSQSQGQVVGLGAKSQRARIRFSY